jgi:hypothetical protein
LLVERLNDRPRTQAQKESEWNVVYLQREIASTTVVLLQQSMRRAFEGEMQRFILGRDDEGFAFKVADLATTPKQREAPTRTPVALLPYSRVGAWMVSSSFLVRRPSVASAVNSKF